MPIQFSLLLAKLAVLAATGTQQRDAPEGNDAPCAAPRGCPLVLDEKQFAQLRRGMSEAGFSYFIYCYLLDAEFLLEEIARARAAKDFPGLARKAQVLSDMAADVGAMQSAAAARQLYTACRVGDYGQTYRRIGELNQCCTEVEVELRRFLAYQAQRAGAG